MKHLLCLVSICEDTRSRVLFPPLYRTTEPLLVWSCAFPDSLVFPAVLPRVKVSINYGKPCVVDSLHDDVCLIDKSHALPEARGQQAVAEDWPEAPPQSAV
jgi:hypothetical protein